MDRSEAPYASQDANQVSNMISRMANSTKANAGFRFRNKAYTISDGSGRSVDSWSLNDWDYKKPHLPTQARGLFTYKANGKAEIVARGYDKFFNVGEVRQTEWQHIEKNTRGPYELSVKENGCIIFIAGLDDNTLVVTSKHSLGRRGEDSLNHALCGEKWIDRQLKAIGKTRADLAKRLRSMNCTAVAELCDDEFEEHVLQYKPEDAGLYLHGINLNLPDFTTYPSTLLHAFSDEWGFRKVMYVVESDIGKVQSFLDQVAETGNYGGRDTEGFVVRCKASDGPDSPWHDWFFKYKFDEPYLMYRQWREVTKAIISGKPPRFRKHAQITKEYIHYARQQLARDPKIGRDFNRNHGIIAMRDGFLHQKGLKGSDIIRQEIEDEDGSSQGVTMNVVLVPIATIGCGKTTVALALSKLFGWGHEQNDNIQGRGRRPQRFVEACVNSLAAYPVIVADRNNHQRREREQITSDIRQIVPDATFVALHWVHDRGNYDEIRRTMQSRVLARGDNHQTIQAGSKSKQEIVGIMDGFLGRFEPADPDRAPDNVFDLIVNLDVTSESIDNLATIVRTLHEEYPKLFEMPSDAAIEKAIDDALGDYRPDIKHDLGRPGDSKPKNNGGKQAKQVPMQASKKQPRLEYFSIELPADHINGILDAVFSGEPPATSKFFSHLKAMRRIQTSFHVTLMHRASIEGHEEYWEYLKGLWERKQREEGGGPLAEATNGKDIAPTDPSMDQPIVNPDPNLSLAKARVQVERVVWDDRVMCILSRLPDAAENGFHTVNEMAHVTVGTASPHIKPFESNALLKRWADGNTAGIQDLRVKGTVVLDGHVKGILSR